MEPIVSGIEGVGPDAVERAMAAPVAKLRQAGERRAGKPAARRRVRVAEGIYRDRHGLATTVKVNGVQREVRFPPGTPLNTIRAKRDELRASLRTLPAAGRHTLNHDAGRYLDQVESTLVSFGDRRRELLAWLPRFGHMRTLALPAHLLAVWLGPWNAIGFVAVAVAGFLGMATLPPIVVMAQEMLPRAPGASSGIVMGLAWTVGAIGVMGTGAVADATSPQTATLLSMPVAGIAALLALHPGLKWMSTGRSR